MRRMMTENIKRTLTLFLGMLVLTSCAQPTPIIVYVTPTPEQVGSIVSPGPIITAAPSTLEGTRIATASALDLPTQTPLEPIVPTTPVPIITQEPTNTPVVFLGPLVGTDYVLPPTSTPRPSSTPTNTLTPTEGPSPTPRPSTATPVPLPGIDPKQVGLQIRLLLDQNDFDNTLRRADDLGVGWLKVQIAWEDLQPNGPDEISEDFKRFEIYIEVAKNRGFKTLISIAKAPAWARSNRDEDGPPDDPQALARFITLMLDNFGQAVDAVEVWNEPNLIREWRGQPLNGATYMKYFAPAYEAIRAYSPDIAVVSAGLAPTSDLGGVSRDDRSYLREMYNAGLGNYSDVAVGIHPYSWGNPPDARCCNYDQEVGWDDDPHFFFANNIEDYRTVMNNYGHANTQMWVTEFGWATWDRFPGDPPEPWMGYTDEQEQATYTLRAIEIGQKGEYNIGPMILWNLDFAQQPLIDAKDERVAYSLVLPEGNPQERPLYWMLYQLGGGDKDEDD